MNKLEALNKVKSYGENLSELPVEFKKDIDVVKAAVKKDGYFIKYAHKDLRKNFEIVYSAIKATSIPEILKFIDKKFLKNKLIILTAVKQRGGALKYADKTLKKNKEIVLAAVKEEKKYKFHSKGKALKYADKTLKKNKDIVLAAVKHDGYSLKYADKILKKNKKIVLTAINEYGGSINYADTEIKKNKDICLAAIKRFGGSISYMHKSIKNDKNIALYAIKCGAILFNIADNLQKNKQFILDVVTQENNSWQLMHAHHFKKDKEIVLAAVNNFGASLEYAHTSLKKDKEIVLAAVKNYGWSIKFASKQLRNDPEIIKYALKENPSLKKLLGR
jgi:hypothetical protein